MLCLAARLCRRHGLSLVPDCNISTTIGWIVAQLVNHCCFFFPPGNSFCVCGNCQTNATTKDSAVRNRHQTACAPPQHYQPSQNQVERKQVMHCTRIWWTDHCMTLDLILVALVTTERLRLAPSFLTIKYSHIQGPQRMKPNNFGVQQLAKMFTYPERYLIHGSQRIILMTLVIL